MHARVDVVGAHELGLFHFGVGEARTLMKVLEGAKHYPEAASRIVSVGNGKALLAMCARHPRHLTSNVAPHVACRRLTAQWGRVRRRQVQCGYPPVHAAAH